MTDEQLKTASEPEPIEVPVLHLAHKHVAHLNYLMGKCDQKRMAHLDDKGNPKPDIAPDFNPYRELHAYLFKNEVLKSFPSSNGKEQYIFAKVEDFEDMDQADWWLMVRALNLAMLGTISARDRAKK